ncbi:MAG: ATP-binding protein [Spirochaetia bacterium]|nr:ATP-binding protein [Spirochaetia bacterium]
MRSITISPYAPTLIESIRAVGYTLESAIADIIDNSVTATASHVEIGYLPYNDPYITILDDGNGMDAFELEAAMRYGSQNPNVKRAPTDLGRFGLGLKTASLSQCRILTVVSKKNNKIEARRWDIDHVIKTEAWSLIVLETEEELNDIPQITNLSNLEHGTLVVWQNLDRLKNGESNFNLSFGSKMDNVRSHLSLVFHRYLSGEKGLQKLEIKMNNIPIEYVDPFLQNRHTQVMADEILCIGKSKVTVRPYILPHISMLSSDELKMLGGKDGLRKSQGFYVYRNKRLLVWGTWFHMMRKGELSKLARIQVDISNDLDNLWTLDIKKSTAMPPEIVRKNLKSIIERMAEHSKQTWVCRGKKETNESVVHIWQRLKGRQGGVYYVINRDHPIIKVLFESSPQIKHNVEMLLKIIEDNIPFNNLYLDLTTEKTLDNEAETNAQTIENMLQDLLEEQLTQFKKEELLKQLSKSDPFDKYPEIIKKLQRS